MIKIEDSKFCLVNMSPGLDKVNIIIVNNYVDNKIKIRYYIYRTFDLYSYSIKYQLSISIYNGLIAIGCIGVYESETNYGSVIIFNYPNSTDFIIDMTDNISSLNNPIIKFYEKCNIENNIFGYIFHGIKIIDISEGFKLLYEDNKLEISKDSIISNNTNIELALTRDIKNKNKGRIQFAMVLTEPEYEIFNQYSTLIDNKYCGEDCDDEKKNFKKQRYFGRISYCDIIINSNNLTNECNENCDVCLKNEEMTCISCKYSYELKDDD